MGGNAFNAVLAANAFPRLPPKVYRALKARLFPALVNLYSWVGVPMEAPEKANYGDLDFLVACPKASTPREVVDIPHQTIQSVIGATFVNPMEGNRTSNYAVPVELGEWASHGHAQEEEDSRRLADDGKIFYQVCRSPKSVNHDLHQSNRSMFTSALTRRNGTGSYFSIPMVTSV